jgi:uncharacterized protein (DUF2126 family)
LELIGSPLLRERYQLLVQGRPLAWPQDPKQPLAVRFRQEALFPCLHPCLPVDVPLQLNLVERASGATTARWILHNESRGFEPLTGDAAATTGPSSNTTQLRGAGEHCSTVDLRL